MFLFSGYFTLTIKEQVSLDGTKVCIALPCYSGYIPLELGLALTELIGQAPQYGIIPVLLAERGNSLVASTRNKLLAQFLNETDCEYLFWIDDDIIFKPIDFLQVLALCVDGRKSTAATYCTRTDDNPVFYIQTPTGKIEFNDDGLIEAFGLGLGFACQHRSILEEVVKGRDTYLDKDKEVIWDVFKTGVVDNQYQGEDMFFFKELYSLGYPTYINPFIHLKHTGRKDYDHRLLNEKEKLNGNSP